VFFFFLQSWANLPVKGKNLPSRKHLKMFLENNLEKWPFSHSNFPQLPFKFSPTPIQIFPNSHSNFPQSKFL
jgi:hypothetical protein